MHQFPTIVTLCGSTRFSGAFQRANFDETLKGRIVLTIGCDFKSDAALGLTEADKERLDLLHLQKIRMSDEVLVLNCSGYIGDSTRKEIAYATTLGKTIRYLETHTDLCAAHAYAATKARDDYRKQWPNYCRNCGGEGQLTYTYDPSPAGVSLASGFTTDSDPCGKCTEDGICPRCGNQTLDPADYSHCLTCGWKYEDEGLPPMHECSCWDDRKQDDDFVDWELNGGVEP